MAGELIDAAIEAAMHRPMVWGACDCVLAAGAVYAAVHGVDPFAAFRGTYATADEAAGIVLAGGGPVMMFSRTMRAAGAVAHAVPQRGDLALAVSTEWIGRAVAVCVGPNRFVSKGLRGVWFSEGAAFAFGPR